MAFLGKIKEKGKGPAKEPASQCHGGGEGPRQRNRQVNAHVFVKTTLLNCEPSRELQESLGPSGPEIPKKSGKKVPNRHFRDFSRLFGLFRDLFQTFGDPAAGGPGRLFFRLFGDFGPGGPERLL